MKIVAGTVQVTKWFGGFPVQDAATVSWEMQEETVVVFQRECDKGADVGVVGMNVFDLCRKVRFRNVVAHRHLALGIFDAGRSAGLGYAHRIFQYLQRAQGRRFAALVFSNQKVDLPRSKVKSCIAL
jgi:hypothetical protein